MTYIFSIPKIASLISLHLERDGLRNCLRITNEHERIAFASNGKYIRTLKSNNPRIVDLALGACTQLRHVYILRGSTNWFTAEFVRATLVSTLKNNKNIETLVYKRFPACDTSKDGALKALKTILEPLRTLTHLNLGAITSFDTKIFVYLADFVEQLIHLSIKSKSVLRSCDTELITIQSKKTALKALELQACMNFYENSLLIPFLEASPELESYKDASDHRNYPRKLPKDARHQHRKIHYSLDSDNGLADIISSCELSGLRTLKVPRDSKFGSESVAALSRYNTLDTVRIPAYGKESVEATLHLSRSCPNLRILDILTGGHKLVNMGAFNAEDILRAPWVCLRLEALTIPIARIISENTVEHNIIYHDYHEDLFRQLSQLTSLRKLNTGHAQNCTKTPCLGAVQFSLQQGLEILSNLKKMQELDMSFTFTKIGRAELEWMCERWPRLESIKKSDDKTNGNWWQRCAGVRDYSPMTERVASVLKL
ncbi:hypothetical protein BGX27_005866 [Mortierella sp. AM989]|nr:hypothetical protein BGX27_005866 [Mortierella sp. AM989]